MKFIAAVIAWFVSTVFGVKSLPPVQVQVPDKISVVAQNLDTPWEIAWLKNGDMLVTERPGRLVRISDNHVFNISGVKESGEGGLLGLAIQEPNIYLYRTTPKNVNQVVRYELKDDQLINEKIIVDNIPAGQNHDGGRIKFGPDGALYVTTGETGKTVLAQDQNSLAGKILRIENDEVKIYSYGHRNSEGLAWDKDGNLWATEHGRSGVLSGFDELNLIKPGANYGWPTIQGAETRTGMQTAIVNSGPNTTWAPAGMAYLNGSLFFAGLRGQTLYEYVVGSGELKTHLVEKYGRLRAVDVGPDGFLYLSTSNKDGRGLPKEGDDKIIKVDPSVL
ncbi:PQQ-dependent sugar dehydrogenase [Candidatus Woesebacteria bacterium]|nr:PQQ-dependent sugar dehydrogenase [Candidatus Woesebacteria bacterium]